VTNNRKQEVEHALDFAKNRLIEERAALEAAEERFLRFKQRTNLASLEKEREERITQVFKWGDEIRQAEAKVKSERIKLANIEARRAALPPMVDSPSEAPNPVVKELGDKIASLREQRAGLLVLWKPGSAQIQAIDAQIGQMEARLKETPLTVTTVTRAPNAAIREYDEKSAMARGEAAAAAAILGDLRQAAASTAAGLGKYSALENLQSRFQREIEHRKSTVGMLGKSVGDLSLRVKATHDPVLTISAPSKAKQTSPRPMRNTVYAIVAGLVLGLCFALLQEYLDDRVNSPEDARRLMDVPVLGYVPLIENEGARLLTTTRGGGTVLESYRVLRSNVQFASVDATTSSILVTSTVPGEGKSITAANLSIAMALNGRQVILVDADLRRPTVHEKFGVEQRPGLTNVLVGHTTLEEALQTTHIEGLRILAAGPIPPNPAEILGSRSMRELHELLKQHADVIVYDSPPVLATADAQVLSAEVDGVIFVVQFGEAKKSGLRHVSELLGQARARVLGIVFNKIDLSGKRSDGYSGYYRYYNYYSSPQIEGEPRRKHSTDEFESLLPAPENGHMRADESGVPAPAVAEKGDS
jgi:capsular exopolysaccharide synthesis family protein